MLNFTLLNKGKTLLICSFLLVFISLKTNAQTRTVTGKVVDSKTNETLIGATVQVKNTTTGTATDVDGNFNIRAAEGALLEIKSIGYATVTVMEIYRQCN